MNVVVVLSEDTENSQLLGLTHADSANLAVSENKVAAATMSGFVMKLIIDKTTARPNTIAIVRDNASFMGVKPFALSIPILRREGLAIHFTILYTVAWRPPQVRRNIKGKTLH